MTLEDASSDGISGTSEAEYVVLVEVVKEVLFLRQEYDFMEPPMRIGAVNVLENNEGVAKLTVNKYCSHSSKHNDLKHHLMRDACDAGKVRVVYARTEGQRADLFTMPLEVKKFYRHAKTVLNVLRYGSDNGVYCERCKTKFCKKERFL